MRNQAIVDDCIKVFKITIYITVGVLACGGLFIAWLAS
jgi:hypothetical protein